VHDTVTLAAGGAQSAGGVHAGVMSSSAGCGGLVKVEACFARGFAGLQVLGHLSETCRGGRERAKVALEKLGLMFPPQRIMVSVAPADLRVEGTHLDLALAVSLALLVSGRRPRVNPERWLFAAELALDGTVRPVRGVVSMAMEAIAAGAEGVVVASENHAELKVLGAMGALEGLRCVGAGSLAEVLAWLFADGAVPEEAREKEASHQDRLQDESQARQGWRDFDDMTLSPELERVALAAATGGHNLLMRGSPGTGKSMLASRLPSILPLMPRHVHIECMRVHSLSRESLPRTLLAGLPPFRAPHHQASAAALLGAGDSPGEMSLAHGGILFLDELPEFRRDLLEALREPLETGEIRVSRARHKLNWPAEFILVAAANNCPCGWFGSKRQRCRCPTPRLLAYWHRLSGPLLDRIDIHCNMPESTPPRLLLGGASRSSQTRRLADCVAEARARAARRNGAIGVRLNREIPPKDLAVMTGLSTDSLEQILAVTLPSTVSMRASVRMIRVARSLADLEAREKISSDDLAVAWTWQAEASAKERGEHLSD
jgi:magnesium chelatase family protein